MMKSVRCFVDRQGQLWIGTVAGLSRIDPARRTVISWQHDPDDPLGLSDAANRVLAGGFRRA